MGRKIIPRSMSTLMMVHTLVPERSSQESPSQVSCPASPGLGTVWNLQTSFPVRTSKARTSPLGPFDGNSWISDPVMTDRKSTRLNSSHTVISYAVFCLKKKKIQTQKTLQH